MSEAELYVTLKLQTIEAKNKDKRLMETPHERLYSAE